MTQKNYDDQILDFLDTDGGFTTAQVAKQLTPMFGLNNHQHSGATRSWLMQLEKQGKVRRLDDQKPVCWVKVEDAQ